jgi:hypothetical protein
MCGLALRWIRSQERKVSMYLTLNCLRLVRRRVGQLLVAAVEKRRHSDVEN